MIRYTLYYHKIFIFAVSCLHMTMKLSAVLFISDDHNIIILLAIIFQYFSIKDRVVSKQDA